MNLNADKFSELTKVIVLGVGNYNDPGLRNLDSPEVDAKRLCKTLAKLDGCAIPSDNIFHLPPTISRHAFITHFHEISAQMGKEEILIFYFSGHGTRLGDSFYLCLQESTFVDLENSAISSSDIDNMLSGFSGRGVLLILDCCESAGFAEFAPASFRQLGHNDFRILLSSSRSDQQSWEVKEENGTIFSNILIGVLDGKENPGEDGGLIYFTELYEHLQNRIAEEIELNYQFLPHQQPVFTGAFIRDPLLFVHQKLTLSQLSVKTVKYSKAQLDRLVKRFLFVFIAVSFLVTGSYYTFLEKHEYLLFEGKFLTVYQGYPGLNSLGFPKRKWTFDIGENDVKDNSVLKKGLPLISELDKPVNEKLLLQLKNYKLADFLIYNGQINAARALLIQEIPAAITNLGDAGPLMDEFEKVVKPGDSVFLKQIFNMEDILKLKRKILGMTAAINPILAIQLQRSWPINILETCRNQEEIFRNIDGNNRQLIQAYAEDVMNHEFLDDITPFIFEKAVAYHVILSVKPLLNFVQHIKYSDGRETGYYLKLMHNDSLPKIILHSIDTSYIRNHKELNASTYYTVPFLFNVLYAYDQQLPIGDELYQYARYSYSFQALRLLLNSSKSYRQRLKSDAALRDSLMNTAFSIVELAKQHLLSAEEVRDAFARYQTLYHRRYLLIALGYVGNKDDFPFLYKEIAFNQDNTLSSTRIAAVKSLQKLGGKYFQVKKIIPANWIDLTITGLRWGIGAEPDSISNKLLDYLKGDNLSIISAVLAGNHISPGFVNQCMANLEKNGFEKYNSGSVIAMFGQPEDVIQLLYAADPALRASVLTYAGYNAHLKEICELLKKTKIPYPNDHLYRLTKQLNLRNEALTFLKSLDEKNKDWAMDEFYKVYSEQMDAGTNLYIQYAVFQTEGELTNEQ